ncbi:MAG: fibrobacter succinogenes major paralogous domain-containing protein [Chlorobium sp.]|uniref:hypothetical protein n=1 Tax=Chlorobium sp. TaxID=1095 RepID=UPI0025BD9C63|nr:hypothetical protein [Chlorobium sp.]MCF8384003.1 fibrobacter succinogenes major paralogous domain-containing protein [Chlorobium sp.]
MKRTHKYTLETGLFVVLAILLPYLTAATAPKNPEADLSTVSIGSAVWMAENPAVTRYRNGEEIPQVEDSALWNNLMTGTWCRYENNSGKTPGMSMLWCQKLKHRDSPPRPSGHGT